MDTSPVPQRQANLEEPELMDFYSALKEVAKGKRITKEEWGDGVYGFMQGELLHIHRDDKDHTWIISEGDMAGEDYRVL